MKLNPSRRVTILGRIQDPTRRATILKKGQMIKSNPKTIPRRATILGVRRKGRTRRNTILGGSPMELSRRATILGKPKNQPLTTATSSVESSAGYFAGTA
eukprot:2662203-Karenia_brevis.AAC.1